jgi:hypothetical protein
MQIVASFETRSLPLIVCACLFCRLISTIPVSGAGLIAADRQAGDLFGHSVSLSGTTALVGANQKDIGSNNSQGAVYAFRNLDTATGVVTENCQT